MIFVPSQSPDRNSKSASAFATPASSSSLRRRRKATIKPARTSTSSETKSRGKTIAASEDIVAYLETVEVEEGLATTATTSDGHPAGTASATECAMPYVFAFAPLPLPLGF